MSNIDQQGSSLGSYPTFLSSNLHFNRLSGHWPCAKPCLVGGKGQIVSFARTLFQSKAPKRNQWQTWSREAPSFGLATFGWVSCIIDSFGSFIEHWTLLSSLSYNQAYVPGPRFGSKTSLTHHVHIALSWSMSYTDQQGSSLGSFPTYPSP